MEESFHYLLMASQSVLHKRLLAKLRDTGLTIGQPKVLEYLAGHDGASQIEIARACHIEVATLTSVLNRMEEKENFPLRFADMTDRPLSYGYARIFSKADVK